MEFIHVYARLRPSAAGDDAVALVENDNTVVTMIADKPTQHGGLHCAFGPDSNQSEVFERVGRRIVDGCVQGINGTIFAYGQTGSGKTHTMVGVGDNLTSSTDRGLIPRVVEELFESLDMKQKENANFKSSVELKFVELYNEVVYDLLDSSGCQGRVTVRNDGKNVNLFGASVELAQNYVDTMKIIKMGWENRRVGETQMNRESSRSHAILIFQIRTKELTGTVEKECNATLNLVDLAGSERQSHTKATGERQKEAGHINASLTVLGRVIRQLSKRDNTAHLPYRDSHLTHILKNSLGGNSRTAVIVNLHPDKRFLSETLSTLQFANACGLIRNKIVANENISGKTETAYKAAIQKLQIDLAEQREQSRKELEEAVSELKEKENKWRELAVSRGSELNELRTKLECKLLRECGKDDIETTIESILKSRLRFLTAAGNIDVLKMQDALDHISTLQAEIAENKAHILSLEKKLAETQDKYGEALNMSIMNSPQRATIQTPRRKSRNPRRDTLYTPSRPLLEPVKVFADDEAPNEHPVESEASSVMEKNAGILNKEILELKAHENELQRDLALAQSKIEELSDKALLSTKQVEELEARLTAKEHQCVKDQRKYEELLAQMKAKLNEEKRARDRMVEKHLAEEEKFDQLQVVLNEKENRISSLEQQLEDMENDFECEKTELELDLKERLEIEKAQSDRLTKQIAKMEQKSIDLAENNEDLRIQIDNQLAEIESCQDTIARHEKQKKKLIDEHNKEVETLIVRHDKERRELEAKLRTERAEHEETRQNAVKHDGDIHRKFERKMDAMRKNFDLEKFEVAEEGAKLDQEISRLRDELLLSKGEVVSKEEEMKLLTSELQELRIRHNEDGKTVENLVKNQNQANKINYINRIREENDKLKSDLAKCKCKAATTNAPRTLRSRNNANSNQ